MGIEFQCVAFAATSILDVLTKDIPGLGKDRGQLISKRQAGFLQNYLEGLGCQTILIEYPYIDRDYLEDYASYYSRCFTGYERKCVRLHFFEVAFSDDDFANILSGREGALSIDTLQKSYQGFSIVNPLPSSYIGRTCLKTFDDAGGRRCYLATRCYPVHLFGFKLSIKSLAFQEQDSTVAACATSALWSAFHGSGILFQHSIPSPVEITRIATQYVIQERRSFPNHALTLYQITHAIKELNLDPLTIQLDHDPILVQSTVYAYLSAGIPGLLLMVDPKRGGHAVTVSGFSLGGSDAKSPTNYPPTFKLMSTKVDKLYVHDDQTGPFTRTNLFDGSGRALTYNEIPGCAFQYKYFVIPVYHKIRIGYQPIEIAAYHFHEAFLVVARSAGFSVCPSCWDIRLSSSVEFKKVCYGAVELDEEERVRSLKKELPRFVWIATAYDDAGDPVVGLLFDATDITGGCLLVHDVEYKLPYIPALRELLNNDPNQLSSLPQIERIQAWLGQLESD